MKKALGLLCLITLISHVLYISISRQYPVWDEHHYVGLAIQFYDLLKIKGSAGIIDIIHFQTNRQPLYSLLITSVLFFTGTAHTYRIALLLNGILFCLSIIGIWRLSTVFARPGLANGSRTIRSRLSAFMAAFLFATYGNVLFYAHFSYVETAVTTVIIWTLVFLLQSDNFNHKRSSIIAGILAGIATLTRFVAPAFFAGPVIVMLCLLVFKRSRQTTSQWKNLLLFLICAILPPLFLYFIPNYTPFMEYVRNNQTMGAEWVATYRDPAMANTFSIRSIMYYFNIIQQNTFFMFFLFAGGALIALRFTKRYAFYLAAFASAYAFLTFITIWKEDRFLVPLYPIIAILSAILFEHIRNRKILIFLTVVTLGIGILNALGAQWGLGPMGQKGLVDYVTPRWIPHPRRFYLTPLVWPPREEYSNAELLLTAIDTDWNERKRANVFWNIANEPLTNAVTARITYEKRDLMNLLLPEATPGATIDYIVSPIATSSAFYSFTVPQTNTQVFITKNFP